MAPARSPRRRPPRVLAERRSEGTRPEVLRDVEGYAIASCLVSQRESYLVDQGNGWASVVVQRMKGEIDTFAAVAETVKRELAKGDMAIIRDESAPNADKMLPILYCSEIIDTPAVRGEIAKAVVALDRAYNP